jgi:hypothetical protein
VLAVGETIPDVTVWLGPQEPVAMPEILEHGPALFLFYLFDWTST